MSDDKFGVYPNVTPDSPALRRQAPPRKPPVNPLNPPPNLKLGQPYARSQWPGVAWFTGTWKTKNIKKDERRERLTKERIKKNKDNGAFVEEEGKEHEPIPVIVRVVFDPRAGEVYLSWYNNEARKINEGMKHKFILNPIGYFKNFKTGTDGSIEPMSMTVFPKCGPDFQVLVAQKAPVHEDQAKVYMGQIAQAIHL